MEPTPEELGLEMEGSASRVPAQSEPTPQDLGLEMEPDPKALGLEVEEPTKDLALEPNEPDPKDLGLEPEKPFELSDNTDPLSKGIAWAKDKFGHKGPELPPLTSGQIMERERSVDEAITDFLHPVGKTIEASLGPLQRPANILTQLAGRANEVLDVVTKPAPTIGKAVDAFLNPEVMKKFRVKQGFPAKIQEIMAQPGMSIADKISVLQNEIAPNGLFMSANLQESDESMIKDLFPQGFGEFGNMVTKFGIDVMADPLTHSKFGSRITPRAREFTLAAAEALNEEKNLAQAIREGSETMFVNPEGGTMSASERIEQLRKQRLAQASRSGLGIETQDGKRALYQFTLPGSDAPLLTVRGQKIMQGFDEIGAMLESSMPGLRKVMQRSPHEAFNVALGIQELEAAVEGDYIDRASSMILGAGAPNEKVIRHASNMMEHGPGAGEALNKAQKIFLNPEELEQSRQYSLALQKVNEFGNQAIADVTGKNIGSNEVIALTAKERQQVIDRIKKQHGDIPAIMVQDGDKSYDLTFPNQDAYDMGRGISEDARKARNTQKALDDFNRATHSAGMGTVPGSYREREELSTQMMNAILKNKYGIDGEAFNPNKTEVVLNSLQNKLEAARKLRLYKTTKEMYGVRFDEIKGFIKSAEDRVRFANENGHAPSYEDLLTMRMTSDDFRPIDNKLFNEIEPFYSVDDTKYFGEKSLFYPKSVADRVENLWYTPSRNKILMEIASFQKLKTQNMLNSVFRLGRQSVENFIKARQAGIPWSDIITEMRMGVPGVQKDAIAKLADRLPSVSETVFDLSEFKDKIKVTSAMLADPEVNAGVDAFYGVIHEAAQTGTLNKVLGVGESTASKILKAPYRAGKKVVEKAVDNPLTRGIRRMGNFSDGVTKRAYFRKLMNEGYDPIEAARIVGDHFMDFTSTSKEVRRMRYVLPFASFQIKNLESMPRLLAQSPGVTNATNPFNGSFKQAVEDYSGWNPQDHRALNLAIPYYRHPILGPILRGQKTLLAFQDKALDFLNGYAAAGLGEKDKKRLDSGFQFSLQIPTNLQASMDFIDPARANKTFSSPIVAAAAIWMLGVDPYTGKMLPSVEIGGDNKMQTSDKLVASLRTLNPVDYPRFYNKAVMPLMEKLIPRFRKRLEEGPISRRMAEVLKIQLGTDAPLKKLRASDDTIDALTEMKFFGMGHLDKADSNFQTQQMMLFRAADQMQSLVDRKFDNEGKTAALRVLGHMKNVFKEINQNTKIYRDYKAQSQKNYGTYQDPMLQEAMNLELEYGEPTSDNPLDDALVPVPATPDPTPDELDQEDMENGEPGAYMAPVKTRMPAGRADEDVKDIFNFGIPERVAREGSGAIYDYMSKKSSERAYKIFEKDLKKRPGLKKDLDQYINRYLHPDHMQEGPLKESLRKHNDLMMRGVADRQVSSVDQGLTPMMKQSGDTTRRYLQPATTIKTTINDSNEQAGQEPFPEDVEVFINDLAPGEKAKAKEAVNIMAEIDNLGSGFKAGEGLDDRKMAELNQKLQRIEDELGLSVVYNEDEDDYILVRGKIKMEMEE